MTSKMGMFEDHVISQRSGPRHNIAMIGRKSSRRAENTRKSHDIFQMSQSGSDLPEPPSAPTKTIEASNRSRSPFQEPQHTQ